MIILRKVKQSSNIKLNEELLGLKNGSNKTFSTPHNFKSGKIIIDYNGQSLCSPDDFVENTSSEIILTYIKPKHDDVIKAHYEVSIN